MERGKWKTRGREGRGGKGEGRGRSPPFLQVLMLGVGMEWVWGGYGVNRG